MSLVNNSPLEDDEARIFDHDLASYLTFKHSEALPMVNMQPKSLGSGHSTHAASMVMRESSQHHPTPSVRVIESTQRQPDSIHAVEIEPRPAPSLELVIREDNTVWQDSRSDHMEISVESSGIPRYDILSYTWNSGFERPTPFFAFPREDMKIKFFHYTAEGFRTPQATHSYVLPSSLTIDGAWVQPGIARSDFQVEFCTQGYESATKSSLTVEPRRWESDVLAALRHFVRYSDVKTFKDTSDDSRILWTQMETFLEEMLR